jgi:hypothetical protein
MAERKIKGILLFLALIASGACVADVVQLTPSRDNTLYENEAGSVSNGSGAFLFTGRVGLDGDNLLRRALVAFDLSGVPQDAVIDAVELRLTITKAPSGAIPNNASLHAVQRSWGEGTSNAMGNEGTGTVAQAGDATWLHAFYPDTGWNVPGGDYAEAASAVAAFGNGSSETLTFASTEELVADVQAWVKNPALNHGWILIGDEANSENARRLASRECPAAA